MLELHEVMTAETKDADEAAHSAESIPQQRAAYMKSLREWVQKQQQMVAMNSYMNNMSCYSMGYMCAQQQQQQQQQNVVRDGSVEVEVEEHRPQRIRLNHRGRVMVNINIRHNVNRQQEFRVAAIWKRIAAELVDFFFLFIVKLALTVIVVEHLNLLDIGQLEVDVESLLKHGVDYDMLMGVTSELMALELLNRVLITLFETMCLRRGAGGQYGGATPGKRLVGIFVVSCDQAPVDMGHGIVRVYPSGNIGFWNAFVRSFVKNFSVSFFFPVCVTALFFQHHRAAYDVIARSIVVEPVNNVIVVN